MLIYCLFELFKYWHGLKKPAICPTPIRKLIEMLLKFQQAVTFSTFMLRFILIALYLIYAFVPCAMAQRVGGHSIMPSPSPNYALLLPFYKVMNLG